MTLVFPILLIVSAGLSAPAWVYARRRWHESVWMLLLPLPAVVALSAAHVGPQSLSNLIEVPILVGLSIALYYSRVLAIARGWSAPGLTGWVIAFLTVLAAVLLRLFMPLLPE